MKAERGSHSCFIQSNHQALRVCANRIGSCIGRGIVSVVCLAVAACSTVPENTANLCSIFEENGNWYDGAKKAEARWGTSIPVAMAFIRVESGYNDDAKPRRNRFLGIIPTSRPSSAEGYAQAVDGTWASYQRESGNRGADRNNFQDSVDFVAWYIRRNSQQLGLSQNDVFSNYLAYHEGPAAYARGSHRNNPGLQRTAGRAQSTADTYAGQLANCRDDLDDGFLFF